MDVIDIEEAWVEDGIVECGHSEWDIVKSVVQKESRSLLMAAMRECGWGREDVSL